MPAHGRSMLAGAAGAPGATAQPQPLPRPRSTPGVDIEAIAAVVGVPVPVAVDGAAVNVAVTGVTLDSRGVRPGDLFAAVSGAHLHRADFVADAAAAGAVAVLTDARGERRSRASGLPVLAVADPRAHLGAVSALVYGDPGAGLLSFGVTGTNGKTTTTYLLEAALAYARLAPGLIGTTGTRFGAHAWASERTTPEATDLHALLATMVELGARSLAMEVSSHALVLGRVDGLRFGVAVFTNLGRDHLDFHADMEDYFRAKSRLFTPRRCEQAVVNLDDPYGRRLTGSATTPPAVPTTTYSALGDPAADWQAQDVARTATGSTFTVVGPGGVAVPASIQLPGGFNIANALAAIVALVTAGVALPTAVAGVASCAGVPGRMEAVSAAGGATAPPYAVVVDYAHTPDSVESALAALRPVTPGRLIVVLGCGGDRDTAKRPLMGAVAVAGADVVIVTDDNPRSEDPAAIRAAVLAGARQFSGEARAAEITEIGDRRAAITAAIDAAAPGDTVLLAGRGHEPYQEVAGELLPFDDRDIARAAIAARQETGR